MELITQGPGNCLVMQRTHTRDGRMVVVAVNLDWEHPGETGWRKDRAHFPNGRAIDLLTGTLIQLSEDAQNQRVKLDPGQALCLAVNDDPWLGQQKTAPDITIPDRIQYQRLRSKALEVMGVFGTTQPVDPDQAVAMLQDDPH